MKDKEKLQTTLQETFTKAKKDHELTHDELVQQVGYALDEIKYPPAPGVTITDQKAYDEGQKNPAPAPPEAPSPTDQKSPKAEKSEPTKSDHGHTKK